MSVKAALDWGRRYARSGKASEHPPGSNVTTMWVLYHKETGAPAYQGQPWCGATVCVVLSHGGWTPPANWISVYAVQAWGEAHGRWHRGSRGVKKGDTLVLLGPGVHEGVARSDERPDGSVLSEEGNTSPGSEGSQFNGGTFALRERSASEVYGYVTTHDLLGGKKVKPHPVDHRREEPQYRKERKRGALRLWETGPRVEHLQQLLGVDDDGYFGRETRDALAAFEHEHHRKGNGTVCGPKLLQLLERSRKPKHATPRLARGAKGGRVRKLQRKLIAASYLPAKVDGQRQDDGDFGPRTEKAVNAVRRHQKRKPTGVADARVWAALERH